MDLRAPLPENEDDRLQKLQDYEILDTLPEQAYDDLVLLAARICGTPIAAISLVDADRQWFKGSVGLDCSETSRDVAFCAHAILEPQQLFEVENAVEDPRFADNPLVLEDPRIRFYAGAPLVTPDELALGTLCVIDQEPRQLTEHERGTLIVLARQVVSQLELRATARRLHEKTAALSAANRELRKSHVALEESKRQQLDLKDDLLRQISHELRTPLAALHQFVSLVLDGVGDAAEQRQYLELAAVNIQQLKRMINDLLEVARAQSGKLRIDSQLVDLPRLVAAVTQPAQDRAAKEDVDLRVETSSDLPLVIADPQRVQQILDNLIDNAIKFTPSGGSIRVSARVDEDDTGFVRCTVRDDGCGMAPESLDRIFEQFHQESSQHTNSREGLGIGLAICRSLIRQMGGSIAAESAPGEGSAFHITLPIFHLPNVVERTLQAVTRAAADGDHPREDLVVVRVTFAEADAQHPLTEGQRRRVKFLLDGLLYYPASDQVLPDFHRGDGNRAYLLVSVPERGLLPLLRRVYETLALDVEIQLWRRRFQVEGAWLRWDRHTEVAELADQLESLILEPHWREAIQHEEEDPDRR